MTVDSRYIPEAYLNDGDTEYPFQLESVGEGAIQVYKVAGDGTRTLLTLGYHYLLEFEEHLDPIYKRGKVKLAAPLSADASLQVLRKTPISTDFAAVALKPFPSESFEYELDTICFIQQEIEGHLCDCRGAIYEGTPPVPGILEG